MICNQFVYNLKCNGLQNPINVKREKVLFTFESNAFNKFDILVSDSEKALTENGNGVLSFPAVDNSVYADLSCFYGAKQIFWAVKNNSEISETSSFRWCGDLNGAKWIKSENANESICVFKKEFMIKDGLLDSTLYICGLGFYDFKINGIKTNAAYYKPNFTDYCKREGEPLLEIKPDDYFARFHAYPLTYFLKEGKNVLEIEVSGGYFHETDFSADENFPKVSFGEIMTIFKIENHYSDGVEYVLSDKSCMSCTTENYSTMFRGDRIDFNKTERVFSPAQELDVDITLLPSENNDDVLDEIFPATIFESGDGYIVYDFKQNHTGGIYCKIQGEKGAKVTVSYAEVLKDDGKTLNYKTSSYSSPQLKLRQQNTYVLSGGVDLIEPKFSWRCYRYVKIVCDKPFTVQSIQSYFIHGNVKKLGDFKCSDRFFNKLHDSFYYTVLSNMHAGVMTDCPHREKSAYMGDAQLTVNSLFYAYGAENYLKNWLDVIYAGQLADGYVPNTIPDRCGGGGYFWGYAIVEIPRILYKFTADKEMLRKALPQVYKWVGFLNGKHNGDLILRENNRPWTLADWLSPMPQQTSRAFFETVCFYASVKYACEFYRILNGKDDADMIELRDRIRKAINDNFFNEKEGYYSKNVQGETVLALYFGVPEEKHIAKVVENVRYRYEVENDCHFDTGIVVTPMVVECFMRYGLKDLAYKLMTQKTYPSYYWMLDGETTLCEHWSKKWIAYKKAEDLENAISGGTDNSHCHPMFGSVVAWLYEHVAGFDLNGYADKEILFSPKYINTISTAKAYRETRFGRAGISYDNTEKLKINFSVPNGFTGIVNIDYIKGEFSLDGKPIICKNGVNLKITSGEHTLEFIK